MRERREPSAVERGEDACGGVAERLERVRVLMQPPARRLAGRRKLLGAAPKSREVDHVEGVAVGCVEEDELVRALGALELGGELRCAQHRHAAIVRSRRSSCDRPHRRGKPHRPTAVRNGRL